MLLLEQEEARISELSKLGMRVAVNGVRLSSAGGDGAMVALDNDVVVVSSGLREGKNIVCVVSACLCV